MNFKILTYSLAIVALVACSTDDGPSAEDMKLKLEVDKTVLNPFDRMKVSFTPNSDLLWEKFDSLKWEANGSYWDGKITIGEGCMNNLNEHLFTDYEIGIHKVGILGYKDGKVIDQDFIEYEVIRPQGDFLNINWNKISYSESSNISYVAPGRKRFTERGEVNTRVMLTLSHSITNKKEQAILYFMPLHVYSRSKPDVESIDWLDRSNEAYVKRANFEYTFLKEYMCELYGEPRFVYDGDDIAETTLIDEYEARFNHKRGDSIYPVAIWVTPYSSICLLQHDTRLEEKKVGGLCTVVAEPLKK